MKIAQIIEIGRRLRDEPLPVAQAGELAAMEALVRVLLSLPNDETRVRVLKWAAEVLSVWQGE